MTSSVPKTTWPCELSCGAGLWAQLLGELRRRTDRATQESGAFLLGHRVDGGATILHYVPYDDLDPHCFDTGIVRFDGRYFGALWDICTAMGLSLIADVHTHPRGSGQSPSDRYHPMAARPGHVALIVPRFAQPPIRLRDLGIYRYLGEKRWESIPRRFRADFLRVTA